MKHCLNNHRLFRRRHFFGFTCILLVKFVFSFSHMNTLYVSVINVIDMYKNISMKSKRFRKGPPLKMFGQTPNFLWHYILITNLMHRLLLLFIHEILFSSTCFEPQVLIFRRIQLYTCSIWYCHSRREWQYHMLHVYNCILLKISTWVSEHVEENSISWMNNNQRIKLVINI